MSELKTLKDFPPYGYILEDDLKAEAVKWLKVENCHETYKFNWSDECEEFVKYFFNLTEEDLKDGD